MYGLYLDPNFFFFFFATPRSLWDLSSPTRDRTQALGSESAEFQPLDHQGIPWILIYDILEKTRNLNNEYLMILRTY